MLCHHTRDSDIIPEDVKDVAVEKTDGRIIEIQGGGFQPLILFGKKENPDILAGEVLGRLIHVLQETGNTAIHWD